MNKNIIIIYTLLAVIIIWLLSLQSDVAFLTPTNTVYMQNTDNGYTTIDTEYGTFLVTIVESKSLKDSTELSFVIVNPIGIFFSDAKMSVRVGDVIESIQINIAPGLNQAKFKIPPIQRGDSITLTLELDRIELKKML